MKKKKNKKKRSKQKCGSEFLIVKYGCQIP